MLYKRDYRSLSESDRIELQKRENILNLSKRKNSGAIDGQALMRYYDKMPIAIQNYLTLFPNNNLNTDDLRNANCSKIIKEFEILLDYATERQILSFITENEAFFIVGSLFKGYHFNFGHHAAFLFKEFKLSTNYVVDYLLVGKNSGGYEFIFVEFENVNDKITKQDGDFGIAIRKGLKQVNDWEFWLEENFSSLRPIFQKYIGNDKVLPTEFSQFDKSRIHFAIVAGRRNDYNDFTYRLRRNTLKKNNILIIHYDNLVDSANELLSKGWY